MAKPFIGFALVDASYGQGYKVLGVVSEARRILYGRWLVGDAVTNVAERDVVLRYDTAEAAQAAIPRIDAARKEWAPKIREANARRSLRPPSRASIPATTSSAISVRAGAICAVCRSAAT